VKGPAHGDLNPIPIPSSGRIAAHGSFPAHLLTITAPFPVESGYKPVA